VTDFVITRWPSDGCYHVERDGEELPGAYADLEEALTCAKSRATGDAEIGLSEHKYVRGPRGGWKRRRVEWIERPRCKADCPSAGMEAACLWCGGGYGRVDKTSFVTGNLPKRRARA
jgi:hypothetical protein